MFVTLSVTQTECPKQEVSSRFALMRDRSFYRWSTYVPKGSILPRNGAPTFAWVIEAPNGGDDIHWLLHIRPERFDEFEMKLPKWVDQWFGIASWAERPLDIVRENYPTNRSKYMVKGASPAYAGFYYIPEEKLAAQGLVYGKRGGVSQNLGTSSRDWLKKVGLIVPRRSHRQFQPYPNVGP